MAIPLLQMYRVGRYIAGRKLRGEKRYPLVLMLEPLFQCNLACAGCGKIDYPKEILQKRVSLDDALRAVDECGAPIVSIPGGEPLIHKEMPANRRGNRGAQEIRLSVHQRDSAGAAHRRVPALALSHLLDPSRWQSRSVTMSRCARKEYSTRRLQRFSWRAAKGFRVTINCTLFNGENPDEVAEFFDAAMRLGIEGITVSPGYSYQHAPRQDVFLARNASKQLFREIFRRRRRRGAAMVVQSFRAVSRFSRRQPGLSMHALEQSHLQRLRLAAAVLPADRRRLAPRATAP